MIVRPVGARIRLRRVPEAVSAISAPFAAASMAQVLGVFLEEVITSKETKPQNARPHIGCDNEFHFLL
jgi:hypothetical protein